MAAGDDSVCQLANEILAYLYTKVVKSRTASTKTAPEGLS